ncbi:AAA family ATPase [Actinomycetospora sp. TBRC 11914]|uniref:ATP-binding protein n=1 Tax=Actinomycetospora sp. TBRC 11914 TaxID=2729387 RepID=UPI00145CA8BF|nr:LuxR family transcriptional regulator [Actinomycetospora sp. TBRC 11914]NMO88297.1 helix-turn-helix transcriptional regulator [Actinomycetospora sp. TBRC 11914]
MDGTDGPTSLIGRDEQRDALARLSAPSSRGLVLLVGEAGTGKTSLLGEVVRHARAAGTRVLTASGRESERDLAFAGLHELLWPVLDRLADLPGPQSRALGGVLGRVDAVEASEALVTGAAVASLVSVLAAEAPVLVVVDDGQWLDSASLDALAFAARRWSSEPVGLLVGSRDAITAPAFEKDVPRLQLGPLGDADAGRLLDLQPVPPRGRLRRAVLDQAGGNPLALVELSRVVAADPAAAGRWTAEPLPLPRRLQSLVARELEALPTTTRAALLHVAVADGHDLPAGAGTAVTAEALAPAEASGLVRVGAGRLTFSHPVLRAAVYHSASFADRAAAHREVAEMLRAEPDRYAWHLAAAAWGPDETLAALLESSAATAQRRGGAGPAARALERAAELSPPGRARTRRLLAAAALALAAGQADWVHDLATRALEATDDPSLRVAARLSLGWAAVWSNRHAEALETLVSVARDAATDSPETAEQALGLAATVVYQSGLQSARRDIRDLADRLTSSEPSPAAVLVRGDEHRLWIDACLDPHLDREDAVAAVRRHPAAPSDDLAKLGAAAWLLDETETAVVLLRRALATLRAPGLRGQSGAALSALQWACIDGGRWDEALTAAHEAREAGAAHRMETVSATADVAEATILALRGDPTGARAHLESAVELIDVAEYRSFGARIHHAAGLVALADGDHDAACRRLLGLLDVDGEPVHHHASYLGLADLAHAAAHLEHADGVGERLERVLTELGPGAGPRLRQIAGRARGLLADPSRAEPHFREALEDPAGDAWPFERALTRLDLGRWLRRQRRINEAKTVLGPALDVFRALGARPWAQRAEVELRACGVALDAAPTTARDRLEELTAQQREIVLLASQGLTNSEIAERLFLSPRTVASHLYRSYPRLGVAGRHQLRNLAEHR